VLVFGASCAPSHPQALPAPPPAATRGGRPAARVAPAATAATSTPNDHDESDIDILEILEREQRLLAKDPECSLVALQTTMLARVLQAETVVRESGRPRTSTLDGLQLLAGSSSPPPVAGEQYLVVSHRGYVGTVVLTGERVAMTCFHGCEAYHLKASYLDGPHTVTGWWAPVAIGPVDRVFRRAALRDAWHSGGPRRLDAMGWKMILAVDLEGDGVDDVEMWERDCACFTWARETRVHQGSRWQVTERVVRPIDPMIADRCGP
jgi:hypothetical protein